MPQPAAFPPPELWIRFPCKSCGHGLAAPLRKDAARTAVCPRCQSRTAVPRPHAETPGADALIPGEPDPVDIQCPHCRRRLRVPPAQLGRTRRCPSCRASLVLQLVAEDEEEEEVDQDESDEDEDDEQSEPIIYGDPASGGHAPHRHRRGRGASSRLLWWSTYLILQLGLPLLVLLFAVAVESRALFCLAVFLAWPAVAIRLALLLAGILLRSFRCPGCHAEHEAVARWNCSCGYHDHRERHVLRFRCPMCRKFISRTNCAVCDATIFLR